MRNLLRLLEESAVESQRPYMNKKKNFVLTLALQKLEDNKKQKHLPENR